MGVRSTDTQSRAAVAGWMPKSCVWELTLACNLRCDHCGSRAGRPRADELSAQECLDVVAQLADLGNEVLTLSGGEPTLRSDWDRIARRAVRRGIATNMVTNGAYRPERAADIAARASDAGMCNVGVSLDGTEPVHDSIRGTGTFARSLSAIERFREVGLSVTVLTTINRRNLPQLESVRRVAIDAGATAWRLQLAKPMGAMAAQPDLMIAPHQLSSLIPALARMKRRGEIELRVADSIGYFGPHESTLRSTTWRGRPGSWQGCQAGLRVVGIEADGGVKGCLSMQAGAGQGESFLEGNLRESSLSDIWNREGAFAYNRDFHASELTGACRRCRYDEQCRGGARCVASASTGALTEDPYCYHALDRRRRLPLLERSAAAVALAAAMGAVTACASSGPETEPDERYVAPPADDPGAPDPEPVDIAEYGVQPEPIPVPAYGVEPPPEPVAVPEYGVEAPEQGPLEP